MNVGFNDKETRNVYPEIFFNYIFFVSYLFAFPIFTIEELTLGTHSTTTYLLKSLKKKEKKNFFF